MRRRKPKVSYPIRFNEFIPKKGSGIVTLSSEEIEVLRLLFVEKKRQVDAARVLDISQASISRILRKAMEKISEALVFGKKIRIEIDPKPLTSVYVCKVCNFKWVPPLGFQPDSCPSCSSKDIEVVV